MQIKVGSLQISFDRAKEPIPGLEIGATGTKIFAGLITEEEYQAKLQDKKKLTVYDEMRRGDGMIAAILATVKLPLLSTNWYIEPVSEDVWDTKIANFVQKDLFQEMSITWQAFLRHTLLMLDFGYMVFEKVWKIKEYPEMGQRLLHKKIAPRMHKTIYKWLRDEAGGLEGIQWQGYKKVQGTDSWINLPIPIEKLLVFVYNQEGSNFEGISAIRPAYTHWWIKKNLYKIEAIGLERNAVGYPTMTLPVGWKKDQKDYAVEVLQRLRTAEDMGVLLYPGFEFDVKTGHFDSQSVSTAIRHHSTMMAVSTLSQFLNLGQEGHGGAYALSKDQTDFFLMSIQNIANLICDTINLYCIPQLVDNNFEVDEYPKLKYSPLNQIDISKLTEWLSSLVNSQVLIPDQKIEAYIRQQIGLPEKEVETQREITPKQFIVSTTTPSQKLQEPKRDLKWRRDLTIYEKKVNFVEAEKEWAKAEKQLKDKLSEVLGKQGDDLTGQVEKLLAAKKFEELQNLVIRYKGRYSATIKDVMADLVEFGRDMVVKELGTEKTAIKGGALLKDWINVKAEGVTDSSMSKMRNNVMLATLNGVRSGLADNEILDLVKDTISDFAERELDITGSIVVSEAINEGRDLSITDADIELAQYSAILDPAVCSLCESLDQMIISTDNPDYDYFIPNHHNCRCMWIPIPPEEAVELTEDWQRPPAAMIEKFGSLLA